MEAEHFSRIIRSDIEQAGLFEQTSKCNWDPVKILIWLGFLIDLLFGKLKIPEEKIEKVKNFLSLLLSKWTVTPREVLKFAGLVNSMAVVIGPKAYILTKVLYREVNRTAHSKVDWDTLVNLMEEAKNCLVRWKREFEVLSFEMTIKEKEKGAIMLSDASATGGAAFLHAEQLSAEQMEQDIEYIEAQGPADWSHEPGDMFLTNWSASEQKKSSTWREAKTIEAGLDAFKGRLAGSSVLWYSDNAVMSSLAKKGSMKPDLNPIAESIANMCEQSQIDLQVKLLRCTNNTVADKLSRFIDLDDWGISPHLLNRLQHTWGEAEVDRFATNKNNKLERFNSRFNCPGMEAIDSFTQNWARVVNLLVPHPTLSCRRWNT